MHSNEQKNENQNIALQIEKEISSIPQRYQSDSFDIINEMIDIVSKGGNDMDHDIDELEKHDENLNKVSQIIRLNHKSELQSIVTFGREFESNMQKFKELLSYFRLSIKASINSLSSIDFGLEGSEKQQYINQTLYNKELMNQFVSLRSVVSSLEDFARLFKSNQLTSAVKILNEVNEKISAIEEKDDALDKFEFFRNLTKKIKYYQTEMTELLKKKLKKQIFFFDGNNSDFLTQKIKSYIKYSHQILKKKNFQKEPLSFFEPLSYFTRVISIITDKGPELFEQSKMNTKKKYDNLNCIVQCLNDFQKNSQGIMENFRKEIKGNMVELLIRIYNIMCECLQEEKIEDELIKYNLFVQIPFIVVFHSLQKIKFLTLNYNGAGEEDKNLLEKVYKIFESALCMQMNNLHNFMIGSVENYYFSFSSKNLLTTSMTFEELSKCENCFRHKISEMNFSTTNLRYLALLYKNSSKFYSVCQISFDISLLQVLNYNSILTKQLFLFLRKRDTYSKQTRLFSDGNFVFDYELNNSFKFITAIEKDLDILYTFFDFAIDKTYTEIEMCLQIICDKYLLSLKALNERIGKDVTYYNLLNQLREDISKEDQEKEIDYDKFSLKITGDLKKFILEVIAAAKGTKNYFFLSKNYKLIDILSKFYTQTQDLLSKILFFQSRVDAALKITKKIESAEQINFELFVLLSIFKIEISSLIITPAKEMTSKTYILKEPQMAQENSITSYANSTKTYFDLLKANLKDKPFKFVLQNYSKLINEVFVSCVGNLFGNEINTYGINLLMRNFNFVKASFSSYVLFENTHSVTYFPNYIGLLQLSDEKFAAELKRYSSVEKYDESVTEPIKSIRLKMSVELKN